MPKTTKKEFITQSGETKEEISNFLLKYIDSIIELDEDSKLIAKNIVLTGGKVATDYVEFNTNLSENPSTVGALYWDNQDKTFTGVMEPSNDDSVRLQIGQEMYIRAVNKTGTTITSSGTEYTDDVYMTQTALHILKDTAGSREVFSK